MRLVWLLLLSLAFAHQAAEQELKATLGRFFTKTVKRFEPVVNSNIVFHERGAKRILGNNPQPYSNELTLNVDLFDQQFELHFEIVPHLHQPDSTVTVVRGFDENGNEISETNPVSSSTYHAVVGTHGWASLTIRDDGLYYMVLFDGEETYHVDPLHIHAQQLSEEHFLALKSESSTGLLSYRLSDVDHSSAGCGVDDFGEAHIHAESAHVELPATATSTEKLHLAADFDPIPRMAGMPATTQEMTMGWGVNVGFWKSQGSDDAVQKFIANTVSTINIVWQKQLNVFLRIGPYQIYSTTGGPAWNLDADGRTRAPDSQIQTHLTDFNAWVNGASRGQAIWHLATNSFPPSGTVGLAYIDVLCSGSHRTGWNSLMSGWWKIVAHEIGHNIALPHTFSSGQYPQGQVGGIMDYGDGRYPPRTGPYMYDEVTSPDPMRKGIGTAAASPNKISPYCMRPLQATCGNGIVDPGEDCDDTTACCNQMTCKFATGALCTPAGGNTCCTAQCKYAPSSQTCGSSVTVPNRNGGTGTGPSGICVNGACRQSGCLTYNNLYACGTTAAYSCRENCWIDGACTDYWAKNGDTFVWLPAGSACGAAGTCSSSGTCSETTTTYSYRYGPWGACSATACGASGTQTRTATCVDGSGNTVANSNCAGTPVTSQTCTGTCTYSWQRTASGSCSATCDGGVQQYTVFCSDGTNRVADSQCTGTRPASQETCNTTPCQTRWTTGNFTACSASCGGGTQTRTVTCERFYNNVWQATDASRCTTTRPASSQTCNTQACTSNRWVVGNFGACSATCGGGTQTRTVVCQDSSGTTVADSQCADPRPPSSQACNTDSCSTLYNWTAGPWTACSASCGGGTRTRTVSCVDSNGAQRPDTDCYNVARPSTVENCNTQACAKFEWYTSPFGSCSAQCGGGTQTRTAQCHDTSSGCVMPNCPTAAASSCPSPAPATQQNCNTQACATYSWRTGNYGTCDRSCGGGVQTRTVQCMQDGTTTVVADSNCAGTKPVSSQACNTQACLTYNWVPSAWSACTSASRCGTGTRTRTLSCRDSNDRLASESNCTATRPATQESCQQDPCPSYWSTGNWAPCSTTCGVGSTTRTRACLSKIDDTPQPESSCAALGTAPATQGTCSNSPCPGWKVSEWSDCSVTCGDGNQTRSVTCVDPDSGVEVDPTRCPKPAPASLQRCNLGPCAHWHKDNWSNCTAQCSGGLQTRGIRCRLPHDNQYQGQLVPDHLVTALCPGDKSTADSFVLEYDPLPTTIQSCNTQPCAGNFWRSSFGPCSASCGGTGTQSVTSVCVSPSTNQTVPDSECRDQKPPATQNCNFNDCPVYEWRVMSDFTDCSVYCGQGQRTRVVVCLNVKPPKIFPPLPYETVDDSFCVNAGLERPVSSESCGYPRSVCALGAVDGVPNGFCSDAIGACVCRAGWTGANCTEADAIVNVTTSATNYASGVPQGDYIQLTWVSGTSIDRVNIQLLDSTVDFPIYIAANISNQGKFFWSFGDGLKAGTLKAGVAYRFRVFFSPTIKGDSNPFTAASPCSTTSCGANGQCVNGVCQCSAGFSGLRCEIASCSSSTCDAAHGSCGASGTCECRDGWSGPSCRTPPSCTSSCSNGDFPPGVSANVSCSTITCQCPQRSFWSGPSCSTCSLTCSNGGQPDSDCQSCVCAADSGYTGPTCNCIYWLLTFRVQMPAGVSYTVEDVLASAQLTVHYGDLFRLDIAAASTVDPSMLELHSLSSGGGNFFSLRLRLKGPCGGGNALHLEADSEAVASMFNALDLISVSISTKASPLFLRYATSRLDRSSQMGATDPTGGQQLRSAQVACDPFIDDACANPRSSKGFWTTTNIIIIAASAGGALLLILAVFACKRSHKSRKNTTSSGSSSNASSGRSCFSCCKRSSNRKWVPEESSGSNYRSEEPDLNNKGQVKQMRNHWENMSEAEMTQTKSPGLPLGWTEHRDPNSGAVYYYHAASNTSSWTRP